MNKKPHPPEWISKLIEGLAPPEFAEEIRGDLEEMFARDIKRRSLMRSRMAYAIGAAGFLIRSFFWKRNTSASNHLSMLRNYFSMGRRNLLADKSNALINILGMVVGIGCTLMILNILRFELSFDTFHTNADRIYKLVRVSGSEVPEYRSGISFPVPEAMKQEIASLKKIASVEYFGGAYVDVVNEQGQIERMFREESGCAMVEPEFFDIFDFHGTGFRWISGNPKTALVEPFSIVLTRSMARKYFGDSDPIGKTLQLQKKGLCKVTGVIEDFPENSDFIFRVLISYSTLKALAVDGLQDWYSVDDAHCTFLLLPTGVSQSDMEASIARVHAAHTPKELHESRRYLLQSLSEVHFDGRFSNFSGRTISKETLTGIGIIGVFLLLTGCINYINLATAQSALRAKEVGVRKILGSRARDLILQFFVETFAVVSIAGFIALCLAGVALNSMRTVLNFNPDGFSITDPFIVTALLIIVIVVTFISASYPAFLLSKFHPATALKNTFLTQKLGGFSLRKVLVVAQFTITQLLVVGTFIVVSQMKFFAETDMGFDPDRIITVRIPNRDHLKLQALEDQIRAKSVVEDMCFSYTLPSGTRRNRSYQNIGMPDATNMEDYQVFEYVSVDSSFLRVYDIQLLAGRNLTLSDTSGNILINKTLMKKLGLGTPDDALQKQLKMGNGELATVVGVIEDYYSNSMKEAVDNIVMTVDPENFSTLSVRINVAGTGVQSAIREIERSFSTVFPDWSMSYTFLDDNIRAFYEQEERYAQLFEFSSLVFLIIGSLGLYGVITFVANRRSREVAIRKVLGATIGQIVLVFSREYVQLVGLSFLLAAPVAYYFVSEWLNSFAQHIPLSLWLFVLPGAFVMALALCVVVAKSLRTANLNPVEKLKCE